MAVVEDYVPDSDDEDVAQSPPPPRPIPTEPVKQQLPNGDSTKGSSIPDLVGRLRVPDEFKDTAKASELSTAQVDAHRRRITSALRELTVRLRLEPSEEPRPSVNGTHQQLDPQIKACIAVTRLRGTIDGPDGCLITPEILQLVQDILEPLTQPQATAHALLLDLKTIFSSNPHPEISVESGRRLARPIGGEAGRSDLFDDQAWKDEWGTWNTLRWCVEVMSTQDLIDNIPLILPPLLILMDDYKSSYRLRGVQILPAFLRIPPPVLQRTGIAQLLLRSVQHSISLHPTPPEPPILEPFLAQLLGLLRILYPEGGGKEEEAAKQVEQAVERGIINGWAYAKSGREGVDALVGVARAVELICHDVNLGVIRWMRTFIPSLLSPLTMPPIPYIVPVQRANLQALHTLLTTIAKTGRAARWRGEILDGVGRLVVALHERGVTASEGNEGDQLEGKGMEGKDRGGVAAGGMDSDGFAMDNDTSDRQAQLQCLSNLCTRIFKDLVLVAPSMKDTEIPALLQLDPYAFGFLRRLADSGAD